MQLLLLTVLLLASLVSSVTQAAILGVLLPALLPAPKRSCLLSLVLLAGNDAYVSLLLAKITQSSLQTVADAVDTMDCMNSCICMCCCQCFCCCVCTHVAQLCICHICGGCCCVCGLSVYTNRLTAYCHCICRCDCFCCDCCKWRTVYVIAAAIAYAVVTTLPLVSMDYCRCCPICCSVLPVGVCESLKGSMGLRLGGCTQSLQMPYATTKQPEPPSLLACML